MLGGRTHLFYVIKVYIVKNSFKGWFYHIAYKFGEGVDTSQANLLKYAL